jgi:acetyl esterase/lipase
MNKLITFLSLALITITYGEVIKDDYLKPTQQNVVYGMDYGTALLMDVYTPEKPNGYGVIFIMGTGWTAYGEYDDVPLKQLDVFLHVNKIFPNFMGQSYQLFKPLYDAGFTIFSINHRLAPQHSMPTQIRDVQRAVQYIRYHADEYGIDPERMGGMGHSSGACMISFLGVLDDVADPEAYDPIHRVSSRLQAVVPVSGLFDFYKASTADSRGAGAFLGTVVGRTISWQPPGHPVYEAFKEASPIHYVSSEDAPMLIMHGTDDAVVPIWHSEDFSAALEAAGVENEYIALEGATHGSLTKEIGIDPCGYAAEWMTKHLLSD